MTLSKSAVKNLLKKYGIRPSRRLGQNFLIDRVAVRKIIETADLKPKDAVLEIGPGLGVLTEHLAQKAGRVIAVEKDKNLAKILRKTLKDFKNVEVIQGDIRKIQDSKYSRPFGAAVSKFKVVGNLPFYLTAPAIRRFLEPRPPQAWSAEVLVLVTQKEVAQRICASPPQMNLLAVSVQIYAEPQIVSYVSRKSFWPSPQVDAAIIKITPKKAPEAEPSAFFFKVAKAGFAHPRKQILNNLSKALNLNKELVKRRLTKNGIQPSQRAETLSVRDWGKLAYTFHNGLV